MAELASVLIIAPSGRWRDGLRVLLRASDKVRRIEQTDDGLASLQKDSADPPSLVLLDVDLPGDQPWRVLQYIQQEQLQCGCIVLTHTSTQEQAALAAGVRYILRAGFSAQDLFKMIEMCNK